MLHLKLISPFSTNPTQPSADSLTQDIQRRRRLCFRQPEYRLEFQQRCNGRRQQLQADRHRQRNLHQRHLLGPRHHIQRCRRDLHIFKPVRYLQLRSAASSRLCQLPLHLHTRWRHCCVQPHHHRHCQGQEQRGEADPVDDGVLHRRCGERQDRHRHGRLRASKLQPGVPYADCPWPELCQDDPRQLRRVRNHRCQRSHSDHQRRQDSDLKHQCSCQLYLLCDHIHVRRRQLHP
jgi:hypothetical protein